MLIWIILVGFIALGILDMWLRKKFAIERNDKFMDQYINRTHFIVELWLIVMFLIFATLRGLQGIQLYFVLFIFFALIFSIRAMLEFVLKKASKRYIISLLYTFVGLTVAVFILFLG